MKDITPESFLQREVVMLMNYIQDLIWELTRHDACSQLYDTDDEFAQLYRNLCKSYQDIKELALKRGKESLDKIKAV